MENVQNKLEGFTTLDEKGDIFKQMFEMAVIPILIHDMEMNILNINESALKEFGYTKEELDTLKIFDLHTKDELENSESVLEDMQSEDKLTVQTKFVRKDGSIFHAEATPCKYILEGKPLIYVFIKNIDQKVESHGKQLAFNRKLEEKIQEKTEELITKNLELENFAYIASHDLKEPLFTITSLVTLLRKHLGVNMDEKSEQFLNYLQTSSKRMSDLIEGILDYSKIGQTRNLQEVNTEFLIADILKDLDTTIQQSTVEIEYKNLPVVKGVEIELRLLFQNLISNAIKFKKPDNPVQVNLSAHQEKDHWTFCVRDNGIGISEKHQHEIFSIFKRLHSKDYYEGTGIGLAHCKKIVSLHHGKIWVESKINEGSQFYFSIPV
ncbi:sensor histidine kinase [Lishizhenia sp.]|uniref:sensor histidine kinase n=1 Tax=Lishizhenia sp. TaxID=2497594 RepID=UPI00299D81E5|nr:ATP-binding protein [Lishizhenia sp.]MDX1445984.1 ATP-binding protein [Lishizhenia sp.]